VSAEVMRRARVAYEMGMLRLGLLRASLVTGAVALLVLAGVTRLPSLAWLVPMFGVWLVVGWRGSLLWRGALGGMIVGLAALALPISMLHPGCSPQTMATAACCSTNQVCVTAGLLLGGAVAATLPRVRGVGEWLRAASGGLLGLVPFVACRCATLLVGESLGVLCGLLAATAGLSAARAWWGGRVQRGE